MKKKKILKRVTAVIPTYKGKSLLEKNLPSVLKSLQNQDEVVIVDDGGFKETLSWLQKKYKLGKAQNHPDFKLYKGAYQNENKKIEIAYVVNEESLRFGANSNRGVELAKNELIFLLNDDVSVYSDTVKTLVSHFLDKMVFAVGCLEYDRQHGGVKSGKNKLWFERGMFIHSRADKFDFGPTAWASGGSAMFDKAKWKQIGGFDPGYYPAYWEDIDLSQTAKEHGWKILFDPAARVDHNHETTNTIVFGERKMDKMSWRHSLIFTWKHADFWQKLAFIMWKPYWWWKRSRVK